MLDLDFDKEIKTHLDNMRGLQLPSGAFTASSHSVQTGYDKAWLRDIYFIALGFLEAREIPTVQKAAKALLNVFVKHESKIDWAIAEKPHESWQYIHARFHPETFEEFWEEWGNKQNDAVGEVLNLLLSLEIMDHSVIKTEPEKKVVQKIINYLNTIQYWQDPDNGIWEEDLEVHASSIASVLAALEKVKKVAWLVVPEEMVKKGEQALHSILPRESENKFSDLSLLSVIYPFDQATLEETREILRNLEYHLARNKGVIRYKADRYYNNNQDGHSEEAEWCFGLSWLAIIYAKLGDSELAVKYLKQAKNCKTPEGLIPELYYSHSDRPNENVPLGWAESMYVIALIKVRDCLTNT